ncbi:P-loop containing nucleoside triphosphate hydrolase [Trinorchestia longiramus]|nr:P-loop containing nucleoside triphosphate hydrolase [Trinorchestia longiramus]
MSTIPSPGTSTIPSPGTSTMPSPFTSTIPSPFTSTIPSPGTSTIMGPSNAATAAGSTASLGEDVSATLKSVMGHLELCPKYVRKFLHKECDDKDSSETYKDYCARLLGPFFDYKKWKNLCSISWEKFETVKSPNDLDMTALEHIFRVLFIIKKDSRNISAFIIQLKNLKQLWNAEMEPGAHGKLEAALDAFIQEACSFYSLPANEIQDLQNELQADIQAGLFPEEKRLQYACACLVKEGRDMMKKFIQSHFETEDVMFGLGKVKRTDVFHELEVMLREGKNGETLSYSTIFESTEKFIIVSGVAGAGKSTLMENIALQFANQQTTTSVHLQDFEILVYIQCRNHITKTMSDVLKQQFGNVRAKLGEEMVLEALFKLRVLFLIDGYDEYSHTMTVLQEVITKTWQANCRVIITTRPHGVEPLGKLLSWDGVDFVEFEIAPLTELEQQLKFIEKYEKCLPGDLPTGAVQEKFRTLRDPLKSLFTEPLKLLQFCNVYASYPTIITSWTEEDVARATSQVYQDLLKKKLTDASYPDLDIVIDDLYLVIGEAALEFLRSDTLTFTENHVKEVQRKCRATLQTEHGIKDLDTMKVLSCVLKMKRPLTRKGQPTYSFSHEADQKYFALKWVVHKLERSNLSVMEFFDEMELTTHISFLEVLQCVVQHLSVKSPKLFEKRWPELKKALQEAGATYNTWRDLVLRCSDDLSVVRRVAEVLESSCSEWRCQNGQDLDAVALMLPHEQPRLLKVVMHPRDLRNTRWTEVIQHRQGRLLLRMENESCDDVLGPLRNSRCTLEHFRGTISTASGLADLAFAVTSSTTLGITMTTPLPLDTHLKEYSGLGECGQLNYNCSLGNTQGLV